MVDTESEEIRLFKLTFKQLQSNNNKKVNKLTFKIKMFNDTISKCLSVSGVHHFQHEIKWSGALISELHNSRSME